MTGLSLALANLKPGTGKTTSAVWLAHIFVQAGNSVLLVDADPSGSALEWADLAAMDPRLAPPQAAFPFRVVALPSRDLHRRLPEIAQADDVVIIDTPQLEDHAAIALSALRYADEIVIPCAPSPIEINRTTPVREEITEVAAARDQPGRSVVLLNRSVARAHSTADAREALARLDYDVLGTAVPRLEVYAQSFGRPLPGTGRQVWRRVARDLIERCPPPCPVRSGPPGHHPAQAAQDHRRPESRTLPAAHPADGPGHDRCAPAPCNRRLPGRATDRFAADRVAHGRREHHGRSPSSRKLPRFGAVVTTAATPCALASDCASTGHVWITVWRRHGLNPSRIFSLPIESMASGLVTGAWLPASPGKSPRIAPLSGHNAQFIHKPCTQPPAAHDLAGLA
jgi:chromosome partitioning protein